MEVLINFVWPFGSLLLFILYGLIGIGLTRRIFTRSGYLAITLAPSMGVAILVVSSFVLSKLGFPLREVGLSLVLALLLISYSLLREAKFLNYRRAHKIYTATFVSSLTYVWPFFRFGSQWISYANDDMTNYVLGSKRLFSNGFESVPNPKILTGGFDYSSAYYWFYVKQQTRSGSELFISLISFFNGGNQLKLYMLILFSLQLTLVISMLSLLFEFSRKKLIVACVLAVSSIAPLFSVSFIFQLVGQIGGQAIGIGLICALYALLKKPRQKVLSILALTLYFVGLLIWYPEIIPFVAVSVMFFLILLIFRKQLKIRRIIFLFLITQAVSILILQEYYLGAWRFLIRQLTGAQVVSSSDNTELFPYFLVPRGLSVLLGWTPMSVQQTATAENFFIILSVFCLLYLAYPRKWIWNYASLTYMNFLSGIMVLIYLIIQKSGFGSFKAALFVQPFLILLVGINVYSATINLKLGMSKKRSKLLQSTLVLILLGIPILLTQQYYVRGSLGTSGQSYTQIQGASSKKLLQAVEHLNHNLTSNSPIIVTSHNIVLAKILAYGLMEQPLYFESVDFFRNFYRPEFRKKNTPLFYKNVSLGPLFDGNRIDIPNYDLTDNQRLLVSNSERVITNNYAGTDNYYYNYWSFSSDTKVENYIFFKPSKKGGTYFSPNRKTIGMYQAESDPMIRGGTMQALGKYVVFQIINPIANSSFRMALSSSFLPQQDFKLPRARLIGDKVYRIDVVGRGSARVVNSMVEPKRILSRDFIQLTLDSEPLVFKNNNFGLLGLYNSEIPFDPRLISVFGRQIDLVPPNSIIKAPSRISDFAQDFRNPNFVYSGIYEDGWLSEESYFLLKPPDDGTFIIKGTIPLLANTQFKTKMRISVDGEVVEEHILGPGEFSLEFPAPVKATSYEKAKIGISFSEWQRLPLPDNRPIAALLKSVLP